MSSRAREIDFLALDDHDASALMRLVVRAQQFKLCWDERRMPSPLTGRRVALVVDDHGWRNTTAFSLGCQALGALCVQTPASLTGSEALADLAGYLDNWFDAVVVRTPSLAALREFAQAARAPVINARTRNNHPCETLGDLSFVWRERGRLDELRVAVVAPDANILRSWIEASAVLPVRVIQVCPKASLRAVGLSPTARIRAVPLPESRHERSLARCKPHADTQFGEGPSRHFILTTTARVRSQLDESIAVHPGARNLTRRRPLPPPTTTC